VGAHSAPPNTLAGLGRPHRSVQEEGKAKRDGGREGISGKEGEVTEGKE